MLAHKQFWGPWLLAVMLSLGYKSSLGQWRPVTGVRLVACKCIARGPSFKHVHSVRVSFSGLGWWCALTQPQRPELNASAMPGLCWGWGEGGGRDSGCWCPRIAVLAIVCFSGESFWVCLQSKLLGTAIASTVHLLLVTPGFHPCF